MKETKQHFHNYGNNFDTFLNSLGSVVEPAKPKHVGSPRGRPPKPVEERIEGNKYMVNGRLVRWGRSIIPLVDYVRNTLKDQTCEVRSIRP